MEPGLLGRLAVLAAAALLAALGVQAFGEEPDEQAPTTPAPAADPWEEAVASTFPAEAYGGETACGVELTEVTLGVAHPVLPCGVDLVVSFAGRSVRTEVIDEGPFEGGREFDLTEALARELGFSGTDTIRWRFAE